jgi:integrase/recombinase XerD
MKEEQIVKLKLLMVRFKEYMELSNYSARTIGDYLSQLQYFVRYIEASVLEDITQIDKETIYRYQMHLYNYKNKEKPLSLETQSARMVAVKSFFRFLVKRGYYLYDPACDIELPKRKKNLPAGIMSRKEVYKVLNQPNADTSLGLRDKAIIEVLYSTGIRNSELRELHLYDADTANGELRITQGKGKKDRVVPLGDIASKYVEEYVKEGRSRLLEYARQVLKKKQDEPPPFLFISKGGKKITAANLRTMIKKYVKRAGLTKEVTTHSFRHTCATHLLKEGAGIRHIQALLGHSCITTTQRYTHVEVSDLKKAHRKCHPREQER